MDIYIKNNKAWLIEMNTYGPGLAAGSSLFHWIKDQNILWQGNNKYIVWREAL